MATTTFTGVPDRNRFDSLMERSYKKVFNLAFRLSGNRSDAEDITQEAFYRAYRAFGNYEGNRPFENWIFSIAGRLFLDMLRNRRRRVRPVSYDAPIQTESSSEGLIFDVPDHNSNPETDLLSNTLSEELQQALDSLSKDQRLLIMLADVEGMPYHEIAEILRKPIGTVRSRLHRTHRLLRSLLAQNERSSGIQAGASGKSLQPSPVG